MANHFVCSECGGLSEIAKVCETGYCGKKGQPLTDCDCADDLHAAVLTREAPKTIDLDS